MSPPLLPRFSGGSGPPIFALFWGFLQFFNCGGKIFALFRDARSNAKMIKSIRVRGLILSRESIICDRAIAILAHIIARIAISLGPWGHLLHPMNHRNAKKPPSQLSLVFHYRTLSFLFYIGLSGIPGGVDFWGFWGVPPSFWGPFFFLFWGNWLGGEGRGGEMSTKVAAPKGDFGGPFCHFVHFQFH